MSGVYVYALNLGMILKKLNKAQIPHAVVCAYSFLVGTNEHYNKDWFVLCSILSADDIGKIKGCNISFKESSYPGYIEMDLRDDDLVYFKNSRYLKVRDNENGKVYEPAA